MFTDIFRSPEMQPALYFVVGMLVGTVSQRIADEMRRIRRTRRKMKRKHARNVEKTKTTGEQET